MPASCSPLRCMPVLPPPRILDPPPFKFNVLRLEIMSATEGDSEASESATSELQFNGHRPDSGYILRLKPTYQQRLIENKIRRRERLRNSPITTVAWQTADGAEQPIQTQIHNSCNVDSGSEGCYASQPPPQHQYKSATLPRIPTWNLSACQTQTEENCCAQVLLCGVPHKFVVTVAHIYCTVSRIEPTIFEISQFQSSTGIRIFRTVVVALFHCSHVKYSNKHKPK